MGESTGPVRGMTRRLLLVLGTPLVLLVLFLVFAPALLAGSAARFAERKFAEQYAGTLEVEDLVLSWTGRQTLREARLLDPVGATVATCSAELPSLLDLVRGGGRRLGRVRATLTADLVADDGGTTNLQRALAPRSADDGDGGAQGAGGKPAGKGDDGGDEGLAGLELDVELAAPRITWSDAHTRSLGAPVALEDVKLVGTLVPGRPLVLDLDGRVRSDRPSALKLHASVDDLAAAAPRLELDCEITGFPTGLVDGLAGMDGELEELLGPSFELHGQGQGTTEAGSLGLEFRSLGARTELWAQLAGGALEAGATVSASVRPQQLDRWLQPLLPPDLPGGAAFARTGEEPFAAELALRCADAAPWLAALGGAAVPSAFDPAAGIALEVRDAQLGSWRLATRTAELPLADLRLAATAEPGRPVHVELRSAADRTLRASAELTAEDDTGEWALRTAAVALTGVPTAMLDDLGEQDGRLGRLLGPRLDLTGTVPEGADGPVAGSLQLHTESVDLDAHARFVDGVLSIRPEDEGDALSIAHHDPRRLTAEFAPDFAIAQPLGELRADVDALEVPLGEWLAGELDVAGLLLRSKARVRAHLDAWELEHALSDGTPMPVTLEDLALDVDLFSGAAVADLAGGVQDSDGTLAVHVEVGDLTGLLADPPELPPVTLRAEARKLPSLLVDLLAEQDGLVVDVLGPELSLKARGRWPEEGEPVEVDLHSSQASLALTGSLEDGSLVAREGQQLAASVPLNPLFSQRVVGKLVPLMVALSKGPDAKPVGLRVDGFRFPLDGDLAKLDCDVHLDLGEVAYQMLPGFQDALAGFAGRGTDRRSTTIAPLEIAIRSGVARYDRLPLSIEGVEYVFRGSYDLTSGAFDLATEIPLAKLGGGVERELDKLRDHLDPNLSVPIEIGGTFAKPRVRLGKGFLDTVVKDAAKGALEKGLFDLLEREKRKKEDDEREKAERKARKKAEREAENPPSR